MKGKRKAFLSPPLAVLRPAPISLTRIDDVTYRLGMSKDALAADALKLIQYILAEWMRAENELGCYEERDKHAA